MFDLSMRSTFRGLGSELILNLVSRLACEQWRCPGVETFEQYAVLSAVMSVGGSSLRFADASVQLRAGKPNADRIETFVRLLRRHPSLHVHIEGHAGVNAPDRAADGFSLQRAKHVGVLLAARRCDTRRLHMRGWGKRVSAAAQWPAGAQSRRADVFFTLGAAPSGQPAAFLPPRPRYYPDGEEAPSEVGAASASVVPIDRFFHDEVAQELMTHPRLQQAFRSLHGQPQADRPALMARLTAQDEELRAMLATLEECAGASVSVARGEPSAEELRVARYVHGEATPSTP